jgi:hypothetical protein
MKEGRERAKLNKAAESQITRSNPPAFQADLRAELDAFKSEVIDILKGGLSPKEESGEEQEVIMPVSKNNLPANYQEIFEEYFDPQDGFGAEMSYEGNISFTIIVPERFSNTTEAWKTYYKVDRRTKVLKQGNIEGGIKEWCEKVCRNIKYQKNIQTK